MAATLMQPPVHRPSMDHPASFDHSRSSPSAPFATSSFDRAPSPAGTPRSRTSSSNLASPSPSSSAVAPGAAYPQPYSNYFPNPTNSHFHHPPQHWPPGAAPPAPGFYAPPFAAFPGAPGYQHQQQTPHDFAAWAHVYQQMLAGGHMAGPGDMPTHHQQDVDNHGPPPADPPRRRTASGPSQPLTAPGQPLPTKGGFQQPQPFHPYKRGSAPRTGHSISGSNSGGAGMPRSASQPVAPVALNGMSSRGTPSPSDEHRRNLSSDSAQPRVGSSSASIGTALDDELTLPRPRIRTEERRNSSSSQGSSASGSASPTVVHQQQPQSRIASPPVAQVHSRSRSTSGLSGPLTTGAIAANATNTTRPSPLSQGTALPPAQTPRSPIEQKRSSGIGIKGRFKPSLGSEPSKDRPAPPSQTQPSPTRTEQSTSSRLPRANGSVPLAPPSAPFVNAQAMSSDVSLAETQRTTQTTASVATGATGKQRRGLFRMRNKSSDNISLSSTVSSASMMIRKMGSLGKLARRNSLMGISKIFKDKPKDEDAALPEKPQSQGILSFKKKSGKKGDASPASVSHAYAELDRDLNRLSEEDDRILSGLSPAAALARQHTVRSRAEQAKRDAEKKAADREAARKRELEAQEMGGTTGVSTWDTSTTTRASQPTYAAAAAAAVDAPSFATGTNVVKITPRQPNVVHHAFAVNQPDYDSDSSDGDTIENVTASMKQSTISETTDRTDREFEALWGKASIDPDARPKKGILRICVSNEGLEKLASQQAQQPSTPPSEPAAQSSMLVAPTPERIDGVAHAAPAAGGDGLYDGLSIDLSSFDSSPDLDLKPPVIYQNPVHNSSAPAISRAEGVDAHARTMSVPSRRRLVWAPECAVYSTYDALTYDRRSEPATCNRLTPELAMAIKQELNAFKLEMPVHPSSRIYTHYFA